MAHDRPPRKIPLYCLVDVEKDGPSLLHSLKSMGVVAFEEGQHGGTILSTFYVKFTPQLDGLPPDEKTMVNFWARHPAQWQEVNTEQLSPTDGMKVFSEWMRPLTDRYYLRWMAKPASSDWPFVRYYYDRYGPADKVPLHWFCGCLDSMILTYCLTHRIRDRAEFTRGLAQGFHNTHHALEDAICAGVMYMNLRKLLDADYLAPLLGGGQAQNLV